jgi:hypothetical protein
MHTAGPLFFSMGEGARGLVTLDTPARQRRKRMDESEVVTLNPEVASMVEAIASETLRKWLVQIGAPPEAETLLEASRLYSGYLERAKNGTHPAVDTYPVDFLPEALNAIVVMGGRWDLPDGCTTIQHKALELQKEA